MHEVLFNRLGGLSLPRKSVVMLTDRPDMTLDVYRGRKTTIQSMQPIINLEQEFAGCVFITRFAACISVNLLKGVCCMNIC